MPNQPGSANMTELMPDGSRRPWLTWMILAGRGFGKTRTGAESIRQLVCGDTPLSSSQWKHSRIGIIGETAADTRDVLVEGPAGILAVHPRDFRPTYEPSKRRLTWPNGAVATLYNGVEPDQLRGPQHDLLWYDELAKFQYAQESWDQGQFGLRLGRPHQIVTTTPRPIPVVRDIMKSPSTVITRGSTYDNRSNLAEAFFNEVVSKFEGTRLGRQELNAEILDDAPGALWNRKMIDDCRLGERKLPDMARIVVAIDPSGRSDDDDTGDTIGIVVCGRGKDGRGYVLADLSVSAGPSTWGHTAVEAFRKYKADRIVAEKNFGGGMVEHVIRTVDPRVPFKAVTASRGKAIRAEPVSALYEQGRVTHAEVFYELEDQMCLLTPDEYMGRGSPDRLDALVWALTELMLERQALRARAKTSLHMAR